MDSIKEPTVIISGLALVGTLSSTVYFYNENQKLKNQLQNLTDDVKKLQEELAKMIMWKVECNNKQREMVNYINVNSTMTKQANNEIYNTKSEIEEVYEKVDTLEETITKIMKENNIDLDLISGGSGNQDREREQSQTRTYTANQNQNKTKKKNKRGETLIDFTSNTANRQKQWSSPYSTPLPSHLNMGQQNMMNMPMMQGQGQMMNQGQIINQGQMMNQVLGQGQMMNQGSMLGMNHGISGGDADIENFLNF